MRWKKDNLEIFNVSHESRDTVCLIDSYACMIQIWGTLGLPNPSLGIQGVPNPSLGIQGVPNPSLGIQGVPNPSLGIQGVLNPSLGI